MQMFSGIAIFLKPPWLWLSLKTRCVDMENQRMVLAWQLIAFKGKRMTLSHLEVYQNTKHCPKPFLFNLHILQVATFLPVMKRVKVLP